MSAAQLAEAYRLTFLGESGSLVLEDLRLRFGDRKSYVPDSDATAFHEGQRDVYLAIKSWIDRDISEPTDEEPLDG